MFSTSKGGQLRANKGVNAARIYNSFYFGLAILNIAFCCYIFLIIKIWKKSCFLKNKFRNKTYFGFTGLGALIVALSACFMKLPFEFIAVGFLVLLTNLLIFYLKEANDYYVPTKRNSILDYFYRYFNFGNYSVVKVNLGQDHNNEKAILSLLTKRIQVEFTNWRNSNVKPYTRILWSFTYYFLICFLGVILYDSNMIFTESSMKTQNIKWKNEIRLYDYFPSQALIQRDAKGVSDTIFLSLKERSGIENYVNIIRDSINSDSFKKKYDNNNLEFPKITSLEINDSTYRQNYRNIFINELNIEIANLYNSSNTEDVDNPTFSAYLRALHQLRDTIKNINFIGINGIPQISTNDYLTSAIVQIDNKIKQSSTISEFRKLCLRTDLLIQYYYQFIKKIFYIRNLGKPSGNLYFLPAVVDYFLVFYLILFILIFNTLSKFVKISGFSSPYHAKKLLDELVDNIDSQIQNDRDMNVPALIGSGTPRMSLLSFRRRKNTPRLDAKAIEAQLLYILEEIEKIPGFINRPRFLFIFDEMDKIDAKYESILAVDEKGRLENHDVTGEKKKQEVLLKIIGGLKYFFNASKSKFIFIGGRELFDAALADINDRDSYISSLFNEVIEVPSFFGDYSDNKPFDMNSLAENYICQFLMPNHIKRQHGEFSLQIYRKFLKEKRLVQIDLEDKYGERNINQDDIDQHTDYIIYTLQNFINHLSYRSNGSPKKLAQLFSKYLVEDSYESNRMDNAIKIKFMEEKLLLKIRIKDQQRFGFSTQLFEHYFLGTGAFIHESNDKLLVSSSYMLDYLYKFHSMAFSWRNLEVMPEIVAVNKSPMVRDHLTRMVQKLKQNHIREIVSGVHDFKFQQKINSEIKYFSMISEVESSAYNFSMDETLNIQRYYEKKLQSALKLIGNKDQFIHSISSYHMILGDLRYYNQEYDEAITHYLDAIQHLRTKDVKSNLSLILLMIRNYLKLGLAFEGKESYQSAISYYGLAENAVVDVINPDFDKFGLQEFIVSKKDISEFVKLFENQTVYDSLYDRFIELENQTKLSYIKLIGRRVQETEKSRFWEESNEIKIESTKSKSDFRNMKHFVCYEKDFYEKGLPEMGLNEEKSLLMQFKAIASDIRIIYQPLIAKLYAIEKDGVHGVTQSTIKEVIQQFNSIVNAIDQKEKILIEAEFYNKLGDLLYYKNGFINYHELYELEADEKVKGNLKFTLSDQLDTPICKPVSAYYHYLFSAHLILTNGLKVGNDKLTFNQIEKSDGSEREFEIIQQIYKVWQVNKTKDSSCFASHYNSNMIEALAHNCADIACCLLSFCNENENKLNENGVLVKILTDYNNCKDIKMEEYKDLYNIEHAIVFFYTAAQLFKSLGKYNECVNQRFKILYILKSFASESELNKYKVKELISEEIIWTKFFHNTKRYIQRNYQHQKEYVTLKLAHLELGADYNSGSAEERELEIIKEQLLGRYSCDISIKGMTNSNYDRLNELHYAYKKITKSNQGDIELRAFYLLEINKSMELYGNNYINSYPLLRSYIYTELAELLDENPNLDLNKITSYFGYNHRIPGYRYAKNYNEQYTAIQSSSHYYNMAIMMYDQALSVHTGGDHYKEMLKEYNYLEDDFNDGFVHFNMALERYKINTGQINKYLKKNLRKVEKEYI